MYVVKIVKRVDNNKEDKRWDPQSAYKTRRRKLTRRDRAASRPDKYNSNHESAGHYDG